MISLKERQILYRESGFPDLMAAQAEKSLEWLTETPEALDFAVKTAGRMFLNENVYPEITAYAAEKKFPLPALLLAMAILQCEESHRIFRTLGYTERMFYDSMRDIPIWMKTDSRRLGTIGLWDHYRWISVVQRAHVVRVGRLEFELTNHYDWNEYARAGVVLKKGDNIPNIHIPEDGPLDHEAVLEAYSEVYRFKGWKDVHALICDSWLLYPPMKTFLDASSRIRLFMEDFDILSQESRPDHHDLNRVFGYLPSFELSLLPRESRLQRGYADFLARGGEMGTARGVLLWDGTRVILP